MCKFRHNYVYMTSKAICLRKSRQKFCEIPRLWNITYIDSSYGYDFLGVFFMNN